MTPGVVARRYVHRDDLPIVEQSREIEDFLTVPVVAPPWVFENRAGSACRGTGWGRETSSSAHESLRVLAREFIRTDVTTVAALSRKHHSVRASSFVVLRA